MGKFFRKAKTSPSEFQVTIFKNLLINNKTVTSIRNLTIIKPISKYQPTIKSLLHSLVKSNLVKDFFFCMDLNIIKKYGTNFRETFIWSSYYYYFIWIGRSLLDI